MIIYTLLLLQSINPFYNSHLTSFSKVEEPPPIVQQVQQKKVVKKTSLAQNGLDPLLQQYFGSHWEDAKRIANCESHLNPLAINEKSESIGLFQIRIAGNLAASRPSREWLLNAENNISYASRMSSGGTNWKAWSCK